MGKRFNFYETLGALSLLFLTGLANIHYIHGSFSEYMPVKKVLSAEEGLRCISFYLGLVYEPMEPRGFQAVEDKVVLAFVR